ncbi:MAG: aminopeptidase P family N-terminal domain-containing protein [Pisciglobus halotolerans]|nr:aminopeptidase P family N-terminal domain-containing protein [Pisciglobus halotolerans]
MQEWKRKYNKSHFSLSEVKAPETAFDDQPKVLSDQTFAERKENVLQSMKRKGLDTIFIYADREHGANFEYLTGFIPRFEEALLAVTTEGKAKLFLGNENVKLAAYSRIHAECVHIPHFSLPNQPMKNTKSFQAILKEEMDWNEKKVGIIGWKRFTSPFDDTSQLYDVPHFIVEAIKTLAEEQNSSIINAAEILIGEKNGVRTINNADEIHYFEFGANLASNCVLDAMNHIEIGKTETDIASYLSRYGQPHTVTTICATGERFTNAVIYPRKKEIQLGDRFAITTGFKGGLTSRAGYIAKEERDLPNEMRDYLDRAAIPYYAAITAWLENVRIGISGGEMYELIETVLPKEEHHWELNPGHFTGDDEWLSSPMYPESTVKLKSGMMFQVDIIPSVPGYGGTSAETGIALADEALRDKIKADYPDLWSRFKKRREYMAKELNIHLAPEVLPLSDTVGYYRPFFLNKEKAIVAQPEK